MISIEETYDSASEQEGILEMGYDIPTEIPSESTYFMLSCRIIAFLWIAAIVFIVMPLCNLFIVKKVNHTDEYDSISTVIGMTIIELAVLIIIFYFLLLSVSMTFEARGFIGICDRAFRRRFNRIID